AGLGAQGLPPYSMGYVYVPALLACSATSVISAPLGASLTHRMPVHVLQRVFSLLLLGLASYMFYKGLQQMGWVPVRA
ncbi:MAG: sulfite exporter TauE/SafE family protein, partial [Betaproteobacteria bacterium]|nr:sulfite exporter TauE/SafE family protein [Betaproteobacteria bacterium]